jgi:hypothetical protein
MREALDTLVRVDHAALVAMADSLERQAVRIANRSQDAAAKLQETVSSGGFEGMRAQLLLLTLQRERPKWELWSKRIGAYAARIRMTAEALRHADENSAAASPRISTQYEHLHGVKRDPTYKSLIQLEENLEQSLRLRDGVTLSLLHERLKLAELQAQLADYNEISGDGLGNYLKDGVEYFGVRLDGRYSELETAISESQATIAGYETQLSAINAGIKDLDSGIALKQADINGRIQDVGGGHSVLFPQRMDSVPKAIPGWCLKFVNDWRPDLNAAVGSAANLITTPDPSVASYRYRISADTVLTESMLPGDLVVYDRGQQGSHAVHGHVAIIMEVHDQHVIVKESSWDGVVNTWRTIPRNKLNELTYIGQPV